MFNDCEYDFEKELNKKQVELELNNTAFANYIGMHRTWVRLLLPFMAVWLPIVRLPISKSKRKM